MYLCNRVWECLENFGEKFEWYYAAIERVLIF